MLAVMRTARGVIIALDTTILLATVPERLRGRITSLHMTTYGAASRVALAAFAGLLAVTGVRTVGVISAAASVLVGAAWWWLNGRLARPSGDRGVVPAARRAGRADSCTSAPGLCLSHASRRVPGLVASHLGTAAALTAR
jgi:hypothetical protein